VTKRAFILGVIFSIFVGVGEIIWVAWTSGSPMTNDHSAGASIFFLFILCLFVNPVLKKIRKNSALSSSELTLIFIMMLVACAIPSWGLVMNLIYLIAGVHYFATPENNWFEIIIPKIPKYLTPNDQQAIKFFYEGLPAGVSIPWNAWVQPLIAWTLFILVLSFMMISISVIFRKQWEENEALLYPLMILPSEMIKEGKGIISPFFKDRLMWLGFSISFILNSLIVLRFYFPLVPKIVLGKWIGFGPGGALGWLSIGLRFEILGIAFLLSSDISLSIWLFTLFYFVEEVIFNRIGLNIGSPDAYSLAVPIAYQMEGAFLVFILFSLWISRSHLKKVFNRIFKNDTSIDDSGEALTYKQAFIGLILGFLFTVLWAKMTGFNLLSSVYFSVVLILTFIGITKIVVQTGTAYCRPPINPGVFTLHSFGSSRLGSGSAVSCAFTFPYAGDIRTSVMTTSSNGLKIAKNFNLRGRFLFWAIFTGVLVSFISSVITVIVISYKIGGINCWGWQPVGMPPYTFNWAKEMILHYQNVDIRRIGFLLLGGFLMFLLYFLRIRFVNFPVHPIGMAFTYNVPTQWVWFSFFLGWLFKSMILKYGGVSVYRKLLPFFFGLIIGAFFSAGLWNIINFFTHQQGIHLTVT